MQLGGLLVAGVGGLLGVLLGRLHRRVLIRLVEGRGDLEPAAADLAGLEAGADQLLLDHLEQEALGSAVALVDLDLGELGQGGGVLGRLRRRDRPGLGHRVQHVGVALLQPRDVRLVHAGVEQARVVDHADQHRGLLGGEVLGVDVEVGLAGGLDPVRAAAEVDRVQVVGEDLLLRHLLVDLVRQEQLPELAGDRLLGVQVHDLDVLLGDGGAALQVAAAQDHPGRPEHAADGDAPVGPEVPVLGRDHAVLDVLRDLLEGQRLPVLDREAAQLGLAVVVVDEGRRRLEVRVRVRALGAGVAVDDQAGRPEDADQEHDHQGERDPLRPGPLLRVVAGRRSSRAGGLLLLCRVPCAGLSHRCPRRSADDEAACASPRRPGGRPGSCGSSGSPGTPRRRRP